MKLPAEQENKDFNEYYGPIDGVRPIDHQDAIIDNYGQPYQVMCNSICLQSIDLDDVYISQMQHKSRLCGTCYRHIQPEYYLKQNHTVVQRDFFYPDEKLCCSACSKLIMKECGSAGDCQLCIEEILERGLFNFNYHKEYIVTQRF